MGDSAAGVVRSTVRPDAARAAADRAKHIRDRADSRESGESAEDERDQTPAETVVIAPFLADYLQPRLRPEQFTTLVELDNRGVVGLIRHGKGRIVVLAEADLGEVDYVEIVRADDLTPVTVIEGTCLIAVAVKFGGSGTRLIDNIRVSA